MIGRGSRLDKVIRTVFLSGIVLILIASVILILLTSCDILNIIE